MTDLPVEELLPSLRKALENHGIAVIQAPPGAGKTTRVPLALLGSMWLAHRKLIMLEPRRLATRAAARYMAAQLGEKVGETVGYRIRMDTCVGPRTRIEVVTEGILTRLIQSDPALSGYGLVIFDEFHERSLHADLALAMCIESRQVLRPDLRLLVMSATLDAEPVSRFLGDAPLLTSAGLIYPVTTTYRPIVPRDNNFEAQVANQIAKVIEQEAGSLLVFLPGSREIRRVAALLDARVSPDVTLVPLYGDLSQAQQDEAIRPADPGYRKVVLATDIAESSLTIEGVRVVIDAGLMRKPRFDPVSGMSRLMTLRVSQSSAEQRRGRAGRLEAGVCYRLWNEGERLQPQGSPEILQADMASLALELALWGASNTESLSWLDKPPAAALSQARDLLHALEALDTAGHITEHGRRLLQLPLHPRLAHMVIQAAARSDGWLACLIAALVSERDILSGVRQQADINLRLQQLIQTGGEMPGAGRQRVKRVNTVAQDIARQAGISDRSMDLHHAGKVLMLAFPDRIARRRGSDHGHYLLSGGRGAYLPESDPLSACEWLAVAELDGVARDARIFLAAALNESEVRDLMDMHIIAQPVIEWDEASGSVRAVSELRLGAITLEERPMDTADSLLIQELMLEAIRRKGVACLPWTPALRNWQARVLFIRRVQGHEWPDVTDAWLQANLENWLAPFLSGRSRLSQLADLPLRDALGALLDFGQKRKLEEMAPTHFIVPTGSRILIDYTPGDIPILAVRLQELFGLKATPAVAGGRVPLLLHLLSPARRPVQVTSDLPGFWRSSYRDVRREMKGRYPKHFWPEDPLTAPPTSHVKRKRK